MENNKCPKCQSKMNKVVEKFSLAWVCPKCGYSVATTISEPIHEDEATYSIILLGNDPKDMNAVKGLSKLTGLNFINVQKLIKSKGVIFEGTADKVLSKKKVLDEYSIKYEITPEFRYK